MPSLSHPLHNHEVYNIPQTYLTNILTPVFCDCQNMNNRLDFNTMAISLNIAVVSAFHIKHSGDGLIIRYIHHGL